MENENKSWDMNYVAQVLVDIWGRRHGGNVTVKLTPKSCASDTHENQSGAKEV